MIFTERCRYYLPREKVGQGTYQDALMMVQGGSLETMVDTVANQLRSWGAAAAPEMEQMEVALAEARL